MFVNDSHIAVFAKLTRSGNMIACLSARLTQA